MLCFDVNIMLFAVCLLSIPIAAADPSVLRSVVCSIRLAVYRVPSLVCMNVCVCVCVCV